MKRTLTGSEQQHVLTLLVQQNMTANTKRRVL